ncbi:hypothetical protein [Sphingomonas jaspsi]|uniref:hypothetical protein n=1 Tax=Sphingomonas jaspsi TaxID=392409 RepID=UPI00068633D8|nr:hypothetical protein [Sphingomonas jaspsi]
MAENAGLRFSAIGIRQKSGVAQGHSQSGFERIWTTPLASQGPLLCYHLSLAEKLLKVGLALLLSPQFCELRNQAFCGFNLLPLRRFSFLFGLPPSLSGSLCTRTTPYRRTTNL